MASGMALSYQPSAASAPQSSVMAAMQAQQVKAQASCLGRGMTCLCTYLPVGDNGAACIKLYNDDTCFAWHGPTQQLNIGLKLQLPSPALAYVPWRQSPA